VQRGFPGHMTPHEAPIGADLTPRERQVLVMVAAGLTNREIGEALLITESTAGVHVSNIMAKLGVGSRTEAVAAAHRSGLVESANDMSRSGEPAPWAERAFTEQAPMGSGSRLRKWWNDELQSHPRRVAAVGIGAIAVLFFITVGLAAAVLNQDAPAAGIEVGPSDSAQPEPNASPAAIVRPSPTPTATAAPSPTPTPTPTPTPPTPTPPLGIPQDATLDAALARCPTSDEIALVDSALTMTFEEDLTAPALVCTAAEGSADLTYFQERAYQAVLSMRRIPFDAPLPWTDLPLFNWFAEEVNGIVFRGTSAYCCEDQGVLVIPSQGILAEHWAQLWVGRDPNAAIGLVHVVQLFLHEARHVDGYFHTCPDGNDASSEEGGAWAVVYWYYTWLAEHANDPYMTPFDAEGDLYTRVAASDAAATLATHIGTCDP